MRMCNYAGGNVSAEEDRMKPAFEFAAPSVISWLIHISSLLLIR